MIFLRYFLFLIFFTANSFANFYINDGEEINSFDEFDWSRIKNSNRVKIVFFDIDDTLVRKQLALPYFFNTTSDDLLHILMNTVGADSSKEELSSFVHYLKDSPMLRQRTLTEPRIVEIIRDLYAHDVMCFALTARSITTAQSTEDMLKNVGLDFSQWSKYSNLELPLGKDVVFKNGIIYTDRKFWKIAVIPRFITLLGLRGSDIKAYHFDNSQNEYKAFANAHISSQDMHMKLELRPIWYRLPSLEKSALFTTAIQDAKNFYALWQNLSEPIAQNGQGK